MAVSIAGFYVYKEVAHSALVWDMWGSWLHSPHFDTTLEQNSL